MKETTFRNTHRAQFRDPKAYVEQAGNLLFGVFRLFGGWVAMTATLTTSVSVLVFMTQDFSAYSQSEWQKGLRVIVTFAGATAAVACLLGNIGRFRDVFSDRGRDKAQRYETIMNNIESQINTTEQLLLQHNLITEADVERRRLLRSAATH